MKPITPLKFKNRKTRRNQEQLSPGKIRMHDTNLRRNPYLETGLRLPKAFQLGYSHAQFHNCSLDSTLPMKKKLQ